MRSNEKTQATAVFNGRQMLPEDAIEEGIVINSGNGSVNEQDTLIMMLKAAQSNRRPAWTKQATEEMILLIKDFVALAEFQARWCGSKKVTSVDVREAAEAGARVIHYADENPEWDEIKDEIKESGFELGAGRSDYYMFERAIYKVACDTFDGSIKFNT